MYIHVLLANQKEPQPRSPQQLLTCRVCLHCLGGHFGSARASKLRSALEAQSASQDKLFELKLQENGQNCQILVKSKPAKQQKSIEEHMTMTERIYKCRLQPKISQIIFSKFWYNEMPKVLDSNGNVHASLDMYLQGRIMRPKLGSTSTYLHPPPIPL